MRRSALVVGLSLLTVLLPARVATGAPADPESRPAAGDHCVVHVTDQKASGELVTTEPRCYETREASMAAEHVAVWGDGAARRAAIVARSSFTIGYHCDGYNLATPCTSVVGTGCTGGWLNTSAAWSNRISSTQNGCPTIRHYDLPNLSGPLWTTTTMAPSWTNLTSFNNRTESLQYS